MSKAVGGVAWTALAGHYQAHGRDLKLQERFASDAARFERFSLQAPEVFADLSKNLWDEHTRRLLLELAQEADLPAHREALFTGQPIQKALGRPELSGAPLGGRDGQSPDLGGLLNSTEGRAVLHTALRAPRGAAPFSDDVHAVLDALLAYADSVRAEADAGRITDVVNIGIGGSDLGPAMATIALQPWQHRGLNLHFVSNVDGHDIAPLLARLDARKTLFIIASKTFTTQETMANAQAARAWFLAQGGVDTARHFVGVTTNLKAAADFGITQTFGFWDWVGGRYSLWSAIGLPLAIAIGPEPFRDFLAGAHAMDEHFRHTPLAQNLPVQLGLLDVWYRNFHGFGSRSVAPYHQGLRRFAAYLQQLEMESNGKCVDQGGAPLTVATSPVVWGEAGTNGQHAYFQMLHQGTDVIPVDFIAVKTPTHTRYPLPDAVRAQLADQHTKLLANCLAQSQALMQGKTAAEALGEKAPTASPDLAPEVLARHRSFPGNRPSTTLLLEALTPRALGALIALHEHRVFTSGVIWGINSFDQWGVELGKALCNQLLPRLGSGDVSGLDASTAGLLTKLRS